MDETSERRRAAMAGRSGGGGGGSSGKSGTGRMVSLQEFVSSMAPLIDLEKVPYSDPLSLFFRCLVRKVERMVVVVGGDASVVWLRRRRRYRRSRRRARRPSRGGVASWPTSSAPTPRLICFHFAACLLAHRCQCVIEAWC